MLVFNVVFLLRTCRADLSHYGSFSGDDLMQACSCAAENAVKMAMNTSAGVSLSHLCISAGRVLRRQALKLGEPEFPN
jgi:hypothetical protein